MVDTVRRHTRTRGRQCILRVGKDGGKWSGVAANALLVAGGGVVGWSSVWCAPRHFEVT